MPKKSPGFVSIFLDAPEARITPMQMSPTASFKLTLFNQAEPDRKIQKGERFGGIEGVVHGRQREIRGGARSRRVARIKRASDLCRGGGAERAGGQGEGRAKRGSRSQA
eukprot:299746-Chlamydomonas_euryale.AAC.2